MKEKILDSILLRKIILGLFFTLNLLIGYYSGHYIPIFNNFISYILGLLIIPIILVLNLIILFFYMRNSRITNLKRLIIWMMLTANLIFATIIGFSIPLMESSSRYNMGIFMIPLLIILNFIIVDRLHFYIKHSEFIDDSEEVTLEKKKKGKRPVIEFEGKKYQFPIWSILLLAIGAPLLAYNFYLLFDSEASYWLHEIVVKQTGFLMQSLGIDVEVSQGFGIYPWKFDLATVGVIGFETFCTGVQAIAVFVGIIFFTPHSKDKRTKEDIVWRKTKSLIVSSIIFYIVNIIRMLIQLGLYNTGQYKWADIHYSISAASSFIAAIIILLLHKWIPEFILSIIYVGTLISEPIKAKNKEKLLKEIDELHKVSFNMIKKSLKVKDKNFNLKFPEVAKKFDLEVEGHYILVPNEKKELFLDALSKKFKKAEINIKK